jgi:hypothetical protein
VQAGEEVSVVCDGQGGNPEPALSLYIGSEQIAQTKMNSISTTFVASPDMDGMVVHCQAQNQVMDSPVVSHEELQVLCKYKIENSLIINSYLVRYLKIVILAE